MKALPDPLGYLVAPVLVPSLHVLFTPFWAVLGGEAELWASAMAWQVIAWFGLMAFCLATLGPALWLARQHVHWFPHRALGCQQKVALGVAGSALASLLLVGSIEGLQSVPGSWVLAYFASACFLSGLYTRSASDILP